MSRNNVEDIKMYDPILMKGIKGGVHSETLGAAMTIDRDMAFLAYFTLTGAGRTFTLPAVERGLMWFITNTSATALTITLNNAAAASVGTIAQSKSALVHSDGVSWFVAPFA